MSEKEIVRMSEVGEAPDTTGEVVPLLRADGISKIYSGAAMAVGLHRFSASFYRGEFVAVTGSSGSGKSTLLNILSGLDCYEEGELYLAGEPTSHYTEEDRAAYRKDHVAFIFQDYNILDSYSVYQNIELALLYSMPDPKVRRARIMELIAAVGLTGHEKQRCSKLSGGQKQRVSIARALAKDAPILFADEPCGNLDSTMTAEIMQLLHDVSAEKLVIMVTHSYDEVAPYATRKIRLADGELVEDQIIERVEKPIEDVKAPAIKRSEVLRALTLVASNNIKTTPRRSVFGIFGLTVMTAIFIIGMYLSLGAIDPEPFANSAYRYDLQVCKLQLATQSDSENAKITEEEIAAIAAMDGVVSVFRDTEKLNRRLYFSLGNTGDGVLGYARPVSGFEGTLYAGRLPENEKEVLINMPSSRRYLNQIYVGKSIKLEDFYYSESNVDNEYTVVGISLDSPDAFYFVDSFFRHADDLSDTHIVVCLSSKANMDKMRDTLRSKDYVALHLYGDHPYESVNQLLQFGIVIGILIGMFLLFRITTGSYRALERTKRRDYNIMRTVGLPNSFVKSIYYVEMLLQGAIGWFGGLIFALVAAIVYGVSVTPSIGYGFKMVAGAAGNITWIVVLAFFVDLMATFGNAYRFNRYFYRQTVKNSLKEGKQND